ncbi:MAG: glycoside hydrolase family 31 protein, partial [Candidatus Competibacteraceae bacterium]|nr:glycoside hydrolase family 31 protein [Candidatus Competibacteraceae bacterium]
DGMANDVFCKTESGRDYVGRVWPGDTVFPDFSLPAVREWWAEHLAAFVQESRIDGLWLDMNEPATGYSAEELMRFEGGRVPHERYHNQYGLLMAMASRQALDNLDPDRRPFILTRAAWAGIQRYSALWTGDNVSSWKHLRMAISETLNLGLSGVAFNGPDVGGFMDHTTPELLIRWYQAGFLFPFFRNHSMRDSKTQEPWQFGEECLLRAREAIQTRYRLLPYLYNVFFEHWLTGDPLLRPLLYEYDGEELENLDEQFLLGDALLCAPIVHGEGSDRVVTVRGEKRHLRYITLPQGWWYDLNRGEWVQGGTTRHYAAALEEVPLFVRDGAIVPWYPGPLENARMDLQGLELHIFSRQRPGELTLYLDDRQSRGYIRGHYNAARIEARLAAGELQLTVQEEGPYPKGTVELSPVLYGWSGDWRAVTVVDGVETRRELQPAIRRWLSKQLPVLA